MDERPTLYVMVGLPGAGKTRRARQLEAEAGALRLTPDEWMVPLFDHHDAGGKRSVLEGRFIWLAVRALRLGVSVVLDFGVWSRDERTALRALAAAEGGACVLEYLEVTPAEQVRRVAARAGTDEVAFDIARDELVVYASQFEEPDEDELRGASIDPPPTGFDSWPAWAADRWPTSDR